MNFQFFRLRSIHEITVLLVGILFENEFTAGVAALSYRL